MTKTIKNEDAIRIVDGMISEVQTLDKHIYISGHKIARIISGLHDIKKDIPIKPKHHEYCPTCGRHLDRVGGLVDDCLYCGQKIDWGE